MKQEHIPGMDGKVETVHRDTQEENPSMTMTQAPMMPDESATRRLGGALTGHLTFYAEIIFRRNTQ